MGYGRGYWLWDWIFHHPARQNGRQNRKVIAVDLQERMLKGMESAPVKTA